MQKSKIQIIYFKEKEIPVLKIEDQYYLTIDEISLIIGKSKNTVSKILLKLKQEGIKIGLFLSEIGTNSEALLPSLLPKSQYLRKKYYNLQEFEIIGNRINKNLTYEFLAIVKEENVDSFTETSIIKFNSNNISLDVKISPEEQTVYLNIDQLITLFSTTRQNLNYHIANIYETGELDAGATCKEILQVQFEGNRKVTRGICYYNLDMIISIGYRVNTKQGIIFRKWATSVLKEYLLKGYTINDSRAVVTKDNYINLCNRVGKLENDVHKIMEDNKHLLIEDKILYEDNAFDALTIISQIIETASTSIVLVDPYVDMKTLSIFKSKRDDVSTTIITSKTKSKISQSGIDEFNKKYGALKVSYDERYHDRYLIIDNSVFYHLGASINYLGKRFSQITKVIDEDIIVTLKRRVNLC